MNLVDGMDGLAGSLFTSIATAVCVIAGAWGPEPSVSGLTALFLIPGLLAFLRKNWNPAVTFMGDHGSLCVGYLLVTAALGIRVQGTMHGPADICLLAAVFSYPMLDMLICMVRRLRWGLPVSTGDRNHMHHRMLRLGLSTRESVTGILGWQITMLAPVFLIRALPLAWTPLVFVVSALIAADRLMFMGRIEWARLRQFQARVAGLSKPRGLPPVDADFVRARILIPLRPIFEAAQFEERGNLEPMIESLRFFCERKVKGHGFVELNGAQVEVSIIGAADSSKTPEELQRDWNEALKSFSQAFRLTYSTWALPVLVRTATRPLHAKEEDAVEAA
jgi:hypothetical protein